MALYEYICRDCDTSFELRRSMAETDRGATCPNGHTDVRRKISIFASAVERGRRSTRPGSLGWWLLRRFVRLRSLTGSPGTPASNNRLTCVRGAAFL